MREPTASLSRMDAVQAPIIPIVGQLIRATPGTISLGQGVVHYGPPPAAIDAVRASLGDPETHGYGDGAGWAPLVARIRRKLLTENGINTESSGMAVMVTAGANMAFMHAVMAVTRPGDEVILPVPFYFNHEMAIEMAGCRVVRVPTDEHYQLRLDAIEQAMTSRTRAVVTISPNNPTGWTITREAQRAVLGHCRRHGIWIFADDAYERIYFEEDGVARVGGQRKRPDLRRRLGDLDRIRPLLPVVVVVNDRRALAERQRWVGERVRDAEAC